MNQELMTEGQMDAATHAARVAYGEGLVSAMTTEQKAQAAEAFYARMRELGAPMAPEGI